MLNARLSAEGNVVSVASEVRRMLLYLKFVKALSHAPYEAALQQLRLLSLTNGESVVILYPCSGSHMDFRSSPCGLPSLLLPAQGYAAMHIRSTNRDVVPAVANTISAYRLSHF